MSFASLPVYALFIVAEGHPQTPAGQTGVTITFLANEGVMLSAGDKKVLIDGLFLKYETNFALPDDSTQSALQRARAPFDGVNVVLVTHHHGDHFHPAPVVAHFRANPRATLVTSQQVIDSVRGRLAPNDVLASRFLPRTMKARTRRRETINGITVELLGIPHGGGWRSRRIEHLVYIVDIGGRRVLHTGDADLTEKVLAPFRLDTARIDVALVPAGVLKERTGRAVIERWIRPRQVVGFHVPVSAESTWPQEVRAVMPSAVTFTRSRDTRHW
jgi:L-ascorbate metabolism protein UlaG (beta-lactamase superfamily)